MPWDLIKRSIEQTHPFSVFGLRAMLAVPFFEKALYELPEDKVRQLCDVWPSFCQLPAESGVQPGLRHGADRARCSYRLPCSPVQRQIQTKLPELQLEAASGWQSGSHIPYRVC